MKLQHKIGLAGMFGMMALGMSFMFSDLLRAQTTAPAPWSGVETQQTLSSCVTHNNDSVVCVATDGVAFSYQGAAFVKISTAGATGPAGPQGPAGPAGPQGPAGPSSSFSAESCTTSNLSNTGFTASGCTEK